MSHLNPSAGQKICFSTPPVSTIDFRFIYVDWSPDMTTMMGAADDPHDPHDNLFRRFLRYNCGTTCNLYIVRTCSSDQRWMSRENWRISPEQSDRCLEKKKTSSRSFFTCITPSKYPPLKKKKNIFVHHIFATFYQFSWVLEASLLASL